MTETHPSLEHGHRPEQIAARLAKGPSVNYLRDWVYGGIDGAVTTFAIVAGVAGANLSSNIVLILGLANLIADGFSMAAANYTGTKAEKEDYERLWKMEEQHIEMAPEGEREEIRQILRAKGLKDDILEGAVNAITSSKTIWIDMMLAEEFGLPKSIRSPLRAALATFAAFGLCGAIPLIPYALRAPASLTVAFFATGAVFFAIGSMKSRWSMAPWWRSGVETLTIGLSAAGLAYAVGYLLRSLAGA